MKRELIFLIGLSSAMYATQDISCVEFVNMQKAEAKSYIDNYRKEFELNHFKTKNHTDSDKQYIDRQGGVSKHLLTCLDLRRVTHYGVQDVRRALILTTLSKKVLSPEEQGVYERSLNKNTTYYKAYSNSSLLNAKYMPLVYLTIQRSKDNKHYIIYEFRKNGVEIKRYSKKILVSNPSVKFSDINAISNSNYLNYLQQLYPSIKLYRKKVKVLPKKVDNIIYQRDVVPVIVQSLGDYKVIKPFDILYKGSEGKSQKIHVGRILTKIKEDKNNVYFLTEHNNEYFATKKWWEEGTKLLGGVQ